MPTTRCPSATGRCSRPVSAAMSLAACASSRLRSVLSRLRAGSRAARAAAPAPVLRGSRRAAAWPASHRRQSPGRPAHGRRRSVAGQARSRRSRGPAARWEDGTSFPRPRHLGAARRTGGHARLGRPAPSIVLRPRAPQCPPDAGLPAAERGRRQPPAGRVRVWPGPVQWPSDDRRGTGHRSPAQ